MNRGRPPRPLADRFWALVSRKGPDECWLWCGALHMNGAALFEVRRSGRAVKRTARRIAYELTHGKSLPDDVLLDMTCGERWCCNPAHMREHELVMTRRAIGRRAERAIARERRAKAESDLRYRSIDNG